MEGLLASNIFLQATFSCFSPSRSCEYPHVTSGQPSNPTEAEIAPVDPASFLPRARQVQWDHYYMEVALTVRKRGRTAWGPR